MFSIVHMVVEGVDNRWRGARPWGRRWLRVEEDEQVTELVGRPAYQQVADDLRQKMASGELPVGAAIPSTAQMTRQYGVSSTVVRAAVGQLRSEGLLVGQPGKGVFVCAVPGAAAGRAVELDELARQIAELREI